MDIDIEINNVTKSHIRDGFFRCVAENTFLSSGYDFFENKKISISLALVSENEIKRLNKKYRKHARVTDVLSFAEYESLADIKKVASGDEEKIFLGEIVLCYDDIKEYSISKGIVFEKEMAKVVSHGVLHLLGFSHGKKMFDIQQKVSEYVTNNKTKSLCEKN